MRYLTLYNIENGKFDNRNCCCSGPKLCPVLCNPMDWSTPGFPVLCHLPELAKTHLHWVGDAIQPSHPLHSLLLLPLIFPNIRVFSSELTFCIRWPEYWSFSFSISPSSEYSGLISFRIVWFDLLAVQRTFQSLSQPHSSKASILQRSAFFVVQLSHLYISIGKTIALTVWTMLAKWCLCFLILLSIFVIAFLPRSKCLLISWLQSPSAVKKIKSVTASIFFPVFAMKWWDWMPWSSFLNVEF